MVRGRPQTLTVLFTDLVASTAWRASVGEAVADERTVALERASREVVESAGGVVVKTTGDGLMAAFTSATAALDAAAALQHVARRTALGGTADCLRIGVSTGELMGNGDDWLGTAAIEASRLCADAEGGAVLVADVTARLGRGRTDHELRPAGSRHLRGFDEAIEVYQLVPATRRAPLPAALVQAASVSLVGRAPEQSRLATELTAAATGTTANVLIVGEPGVGKTRLAAAAAELAADHGMTVLHGRCDEGSAAPYQPLVDAFRPWLEGLPDHVLRRLADDDGGRLSGLWPHLATRRPDESVPRSGDPETERWLLFEALATLITAADEPVLLVVDDLQWAEPSTRALLGHLVRRSLPSLAVLATARRGVDLSAPFGDLGTSIAVTTIELGGLHEHDVSELVARRVGHLPPDELAQHLWRQTAGNPFFLGALLDHLDDVTTIRHEDGTWSTATTLDAAGVPDDVRAVVRRRLAALGSVARRTLDVAAVCGLTFGESTVRAVLGSDIDQNVEALDDGVAVGVVREDGAGRYAFVHALVRDTVLEDLSDTRLARLHWRVAEELERRPDRGDRLDEIAGHYLAAGDLGDAATLLRACLEAGDAAMARLAFDEAAGVYRTALAALDGLPPDADVRYRVLTSLGAALNTRRGEVADSLWLEAALIAEAAGDPQRVFDALVGYDYVVRLQDQGEVVRLLDVVLELIGPEDSPLRARAIAWRHLHTMRAMGRAPDVVELDEAVEMARRTNDRTALASTLQARLAVIGQSPDASAMLRDAEELASLDGDRDSHWMLASRDIARALLRLGRRADAEEHVARNQAEAERSSVGMAVNGALMLRSTIATASGDFGEGKRLAAEAAGRPAGQADTLALARGAQLAVAWYEEGRIDAVIAMLRQLDRGVVGLTPWLAMLASLLAENGDTADAEAELGRLMPRLDQGFTSLYGSPVAVRYVVEGCARLGHRTWAQQLLPNVEPWSGHMLVVNTSIECAADRSLGHLLATVGRLDEAIDAYSAGAALERRAGFPPLFARTGYWHARALLGRDRPGDAEHAAELLAETIEVTERLGMRLLGEQAVELSKAGS